MGNISSKHFGKILLIFSVLTMIFFLLTDLFGFGNDGLGASQILGLQIGAIGLFGGGYFLFIFPEQNINLLKKITSIFSWLVDLPISTWVFLGFGVVFISFFIFPVFFNHQRSYWYFVGYLPHKNPIGLDNRGAVLYIEQWLTQGVSPYADDYLPYPPLAILMLAPLTLLGYPSHYFFITIVTLFFYVMAVVGANYLVIRKRSSSTILVTTSLIGLFSYGFQFELERGQFNVIAYALCLMAVFLFHHDDLYRYPAYLLFSLGVQMKIYPVILIVMFIKDWRKWKNDIKGVAGLLLFNLALLFVAGYQMFIDFFESVSALQISSVSWDGNLSVRAFIDQLYLNGYGLIDVNNIPSFLKENASIVELVLVGLLGGCVVNVIHIAYHQGQKSLNFALLLICTVCALVIPATSNDYKLPILAIPMALFWSNLTMPDRLWKKLTVIIMVVLSALIYWSVQYPFIVRPSYFNRSFPAVFLIGLIGAVMPYMAWLGNPKDIKEI